MAALKFFILIAAFTTVLAQSPFDLLLSDNVIIKDRNTIFGDERLKGEIFEDLDDFEDRNTDESAMFRLPTTTRPRHYNIFWQFDMVQLYVTGWVEIDLYATQANVNEIVIHADDLVINTVVLNLGNTVIQNTYRIENETNFMYIWPQNHSLQYNAVGDSIIYRLRIEFEFPMRTDMYGIYRSWYRDQLPPTPTEQEEANSVIWMASTQFQGTSARRAFPCYDEPSFKATFIVTISRPQLYNSWSCTKQRVTGEPSTDLGYYNDIYEQTPIMSTYLLALIVSRYESQSYNDSGRFYEVIARPSALYQTNYSFDIGRELLDKMNEHTDYDFYSVENMKMTQAAIPDFSAGAMENWGLLTYREAYLLYTEEDSNHHSKQLIAYILSHEIAHMWFGNLVTCDWWDVLWLNEGFARYYQYYLTHWVDGELGLGTRFITEQVHTALLADSANNPHPLSTRNIGSTGAVSGMFSTLSYNKGAAVIRMTEHLMGSDIHEQGLRNYLRNRQFQTALPIHLFRELQNVSVAYNAISQYGEDFNIIDYYNSWTEQPGHPVLNVHVNHATGDMIITQRRFNINTGVSNNNLNYIIPITFVTASSSIAEWNNTKPTHIIRNAVTIINRGTVGDEWVVFNKQQTGFYRVYYDDYTWDLIALQLQVNVDSIHEYNRAQIVDDVFSFARSGLMNYTRAFTLLSFLENDISYAPWVAAISHFDWLRNRLAFGAPQELQQLHELIGNWSTRAIDHLGYTPDDTEEPFMRAYFRYRLATHLCAVGVQSCREAASQQFEELVVNGTEVDVNNRNWVYCNALRQDGDFEFLFRRFRQHNVYTEKILILGALGCTPNATALGILLDAIVEDNYMIRPQDYTTAFSTAVNGNDGNAQIVFDYIAQNLTRVASAFNNNIRTPLSYVAARLRTDEEITQFQIWANETREELGDRYEAVYNDAVLARQNIEWTAEVISDISNYFTSPPIEIQTSTAPDVVPPVTSTVVPDTLVQPATPELPEVPESGAATYYISIAILAVAGIVNLLL